RCRPNHRARQRTETVRGWRGFWQLGLSGTALRPPAAAARTPAGASGMRAPRKRGARNARGSRTAATGAPVASFDRGSCFTSLGMRVAALTVQKDLGIGAPWFDEDQASTVGLVVLGAGLDVVEREFPKQECLVGGVLESNVGDAAALVQPQDPLHAPEMSQRMARREQGLHELGQLGADPFRLGLR